MPVAGNIGSSSIGLSRMIQARLRDGAQALKNSGVRSQEFESCRMGRPHSALWIVIHRLPCDEQWIRRQYSFAPMGICFLNSCNT
jgi:hypothetical protein